MKLGLLGPEHMAIELPPQQPSCRLEKLGLMELRSRVPRRNLNSRRFLVTLDLLGPGLVARTAPLQQTQCLLMKLDLGCERHSATTESAPAVSPGDAASSGSRAGGTTSKAPYAADAKSVAEARPRGIVRLGVYFRAWTRVNFALAEGTREVWWWGDATETALTVESGKCR